MHLRDNPLFETTKADYGFGLEQIAESGRTAGLGSVLRTLTGVATPISPGVYAVHKDPEPLYALGLEDLGLGVEALAEDGNWEPLSTSMLSNARMMALSDAGTYSVPVGLTQVGPARPGEAFELIVTGVPGDHVSFASMFGMSNDWFFATRPEGIELFDALGAPHRGDVSSAIALYDVGTELDQEIGIGADTGPQQTGPNTGRRSDQAGARGLADHPRSSRELAPARHARADVTRFTGAECRAPRYRSGMQPVFDESECQLEPVATQQIIEHVRSRWKLEKCVLCAGQEFAIHAQVTLRFENDPITLMGDGPQRPCAAILCSSCGYVLLLDLATIGLVFGDDEELGDATVTSGPFR
ncbi:MAG: spondin domain-containing protein [Deltaproteobacteria bacterium]|nr:spondin domain-containing protein [Deltaproteobacteria bacterium]